MPRIQVRTPSSNGRPVTNMVPMRHDADESRRRHLEQLRERIESDSYTVDPHKVAEAILRRLQTR